MIDSVAHGKIVHVLSPGDGKTVKTAKTAVVVMSVSQRPEVQNFEPARGEGLSQGLTLVV
jgi:hypothetical protein